MLSMLASLLVLGLLVIVHELGHYVVARRRGVRILRFSIGFGPRLFAWTKGHTEYAISAIPLGGYVKMAGEQTAEHTQEPWEYLSKPVGTRAQIVFAGPLVNYVVALLGLWVMFLIGYPELLPVVGKVLPQMPAQAAGLQPGDRIQAINDRTVRTWEEMTKLIYVSPEKPLTFRLGRGADRLTVSVIPKSKAITDLAGRAKTIGVVGIVPSGAFEAHRFGPIAAVGRAIRQHNEWVAQTFLALWSMGTGRLSVRESVTGPIGILFMTSEAVRMGVAPLLYLVSLFSLSLAIFNVFPIPILDGGHLFFLVLEKLRGRPVSINVQERSAQVSLALLIVFVLMICFNDVSRFGLFDRVLDWVKP